MFVEPSQVGLVQHRCLVQPRPNLAERFQRFKLKVRLGQGVQGLEEVGYLVDRTIAVRRQLLPDGHSPAVNGDRLDEPMSGVDRGDAMTGEPVGDGDLALGNVGTPWPGDAGHELPRGVAIWRSQRSGSARRLWRRVPAPRRRRGVRGGRP